MCINRKKSLNSNSKEQKPQISASSNAESQKPSPAQSGAAVSSLPTKEKDKEVEKSSDVAENTAVKPAEKEQVKEEKPEEPLHIKVPPPRILKAKRSPKEVRASDPQYKTLELDLSDWDSVKIIKKSEANLDEILKKDVALEGTQISVSDLQ
ncbi:unnamed protein product [Cylicocyclus nassatus]|uniref:Uncharacterized protein n=1 Tax=Cylicocyclus nassatus TaxID=53992 RepID=A0AA36M374_CYLNA|nr:unnamed protein product [Cylicocyclus nassatus]